MRILVVGGGAREHAIVDALLKDDVEAYSYMASPNPGIKDTVSGYFIGKIEDTDSAARYAMGSRIDLAIIGPEAALAAGMVDKLEKNSIPCIGPDREHAQLESSKGFTRNLLQKYGIDASPRFRVFDKNTDAREIVEFMDELGQFVVKPDGLTGGKGVKLLGEHLESKEDAMLYCNEIIGNHSPVIVEEKLDGEEFSLQTLTDGKSFLHFPPVQDHKRAFDGDEGPNTGGMGSYSDANMLLPFLEQRDINDARAITERVASAIEQELGTPYKGVMYGGFMKTAAGIKLIEYNARFGDPEAMNVLPLLKTSFAEICSAAAEGRLGELNVEFESKATVCKYVVPEGYPDSPKPGKIKVPENMEALAYYANVEEKNGELWTAKSRAIAFVGIAETLKKAEKMAEEAADKVEGAVYHRKDIGTVELLDKRIKHIRDMEKTAREKDAPAMKALYTPKNEPMKVAAFMSGKGSNLLKILEMQKKLGAGCPFRIALVFSDVKDEKKCNARKIAEEHGITYACSDIKEFYAKKNADRKDLEARKEYDRETAKLLKQQIIDAVALCGYMSIITREICDRFLTINVHPADLRILDAEGKRKYAGCIGTGCIRKAIESGGKEVRSSAHMVTSQVDGGPVLTVSEAVKIEGTDEHAMLEKLKEKGDWKIYPETIKRLAEGRFYMDEDEGIIIDLVEEKELIRSKLREMRDRLSDADVKKKSAEITERLIKQDEYAKAATIMFYFGVNKEVHTEAAMKHAINSNKTVVVPVTDVNDMRIIPAKLENIHQTKPGAFGIPEPAVVREIGTEEIELVIVPGIAFDSQGNRVGYGLGYYDKFLQKSKAGKIALAYEMQITDRIRATRHDIPVDKIITEKRTIGVVR